MFRVRQYKGHKINRRVPAALFAIALLALPVVAMARTALIATPLGNIEIELLEADAPKTVANFLNYVESGRYANTFIHRNIPGFVIQGGGFTFTGGNTAPGVVRFPAVENEFKISNTRGTVAMAKLDNQPDSATNEWFINLADNSANLDTQNGGFTVFARVIGNGMAVADAISQLKTIQTNTTFTDLPVINYTEGNFLTVANLAMTAITVDAVTPPPDGFVMNAGLNDAWYNPNTDGQGFFITVYPNIGMVSLAWFTYDTALPAPGATANLGSPGHRWLTALGTIQGDTAVLNIDVASGGLFDTSTVIDHQPDGTITLSFADCSAGLVEYNIPSINQQGNVPIQRVANDNVVVCEALSGQ